MSPSSRPAITGMAYAKNEGRFFLEWIAYHRLIGVTDFLIYTNDCEDESPALLDRLQEMGLVTHVPNPLEPGENPQQKALTRANDHPLVTASDYVLQIDIDEFLCVKAGDGRIADLIATAPDADAICLQMRFFGDAGLKKLPDGLVIESLTSASPEDFEYNNILKTLVRNNGMFKRITANHMPGFRLKTKKEPVVFNSGGVEIPAEVHNRQRLRTIPDAYRSMKYAQLNHYAVKTFPDYCAKRYRGDASLHDEKLGMAYWRLRNRNDVSDTAILRHAGETRNLMQEWLRDPVLAACNARCFAAYDAILERAKDVFK